jgi:hypothetical protein
MNLLTLKGEKMVDADIERHHQDWLLSTLQVHLCNAGQKQSSCTE